MKPEHIVKKVPITSAVGAEVLRASYGALQMPVSMLRAIEASMLLGPHYAAPSIPMIWDPVNLAYRVVPWLPDLGQNGTILTGAFIDVSRSILEASSGDQGVIKLFGGPVPQAGTFGSPFTEIVVRTNSSTSDNLTFAVFYFRQWLGMTSPVGLWTDAWGVGYRPFAWGENTQYFGGTIVTWGGVNYSCNITHVSVPATPPPAAPAQWTVTDGYPNWPSSWTQTFEIALTQLNAYQPFYSPPTVTPFNLADERFQNFISGLRQGVVVL